MPTPWRRGKANERGRERQPACPRRPGAAAAPGPVTRFAVAFFVLYALAVTWPGMIPFNRIRPFVLGLPFSLVWPALWIVLGLLVFVLLEWRRAPGSDEE